MGATTTVNNRTVVHKDSGGITVSCPDVCKTPSPGGPIPIPYVNIARSADTSQGSSSVKVDGNPVMLQGSYFAKSSGDEAGSAGGVVSGVTKGKAQFVNYSFDVAIEGKCVPRQLDPMVSNIGGAPNSAPAAEMQAPLVSAAATIKAIEPDALHTLKLRFLFKHSHALTQSNLAPSFVTPLQLAGPQTLRYERHAGYAATPVFNVKQGDYRLRFDAFKLDEIAIKERER